MSDWPALDRLPLDDREATRAALLKPTLAFASSEVPYYRRKVGRSTRLSSFPILHKHEAIAHQRELLSDRRDAFTGLISSGTQHGDGGLLQIPRVESELAAIAAFREVTIGAPRRAELVLEVRAAHHGAAAVDTGRLLVPWTYSAQSLRLVEQMLSTPQVDGRRVRHLVINAGALMPLTSWFLSRGVNTKRFGLRSIGTTSFRLSPFWRSLVTEVWGCRVVDNFSLSELPAPATECEACGFNHWTAPPMVSEILDPISLKPTRGTGALVVTTLGPFVTRLPLIRYWTGDLVTLGPKCAEFGESGIRARGRISQSLIHRKHGLLIAALDVSESLEGRAEVARHPHPMETLGLIPQSECGAVKCELSLTAKIARVKIELRFDPLIFSDEARALGDALTKQLANTALRAFERDGGELVIEFVHPGSLTGKWVKF